MKLTQAIAKLLSIKTHDNLARMYHEGMECQINVKNMGQKTAEDGNYFKDNQGNRWYNIRIPKNADSVPEFDLDRKVPFDLERYTMGIGMTGWNWKKLQSIFCIYDFDTIVGHSDKHTAKISDAEMDRVREAASNIPWVTTRRSTGGKGLHLHVDFPIPESTNDANFLRTNNHSEHAALARAILGQMSAIAGYDFSAAVDICGGNTWFCHTKMDSSEGKGLTTIKHADRPINMKEIPQNWRDHITITTGKGRKLIPESIRKAGLADQYEQMVSGRKLVALDEKHKALFEYLTDQGLYWHWESEERRLVTNTLHLQRANKRMKYPNGDRVKGLFESTSSGSTEYNCYCFPIKEGGWIVRRYSKGAKEHDSWTQDGAGWTKAYFNRPATFDVACRGAGGVIHPDKGYFVFKDGLQAAEALSTLELVAVIPQTMENSKVVLRRNKHGVVSVVYMNANELIANQLDGWFYDEKRKEVSYTYVDSVENTLDDSEDTTDVDAMFRHLVAQGLDAGWALLGAHGWIHEKIENIRLALSSMGFNAKQQGTMLGSSVIDAWQIVNKPFQDEYPGNRTWNKDAAQLAYPPEKGSVAQPEDYKNWLKVLNHVGGGLTQYVKVDEWCMKNGIKTGGEYLMLWCASLFQYPDQPLPYLFLYGKQNTGKSMFHEALNLLFTKGYVRADAALSPSNEFNGELEGCVLAVVEETDVGGNKKSANRMKDWVTSPKMAIHPKGGTPFIVENTSHWIQCSNDHSYCPRLDGDTRVTMIYVPQLVKEEYIAKGVFEILLRKEAPSFTTALMAMTIPESSDRLRIPIITTQEKEMAEADNKCPLASFIEDALEEVDGQCIELGELHNQFMGTLDKGETSQWSRTKFRTSLPVSIAKGKYTGNKMYLGNVFWRGKESAHKQTQGKFIVYDGKLILDSKAIKHGLSVTDFQKNGGGDAS